SKVYAALRGLDRSAYEAADLAQLDGALDPPTRIDRAKAVAVLKAIRGSTSDDKMSLEQFFPARTEGERSIGEFIKRRHDALGVGYHDFWPYLRAKGWLR